MSPSQQCNSSSSGSKVEEGSRVSFPRLGGVVKREATSIIAGTTGSEWSVEEQQKLNEAMLRFPPTKFTTGERLMHLAAQLPKRTSRDVAFRLNWMAQLQGIATTQRPHTAVAVQLVLPASCPSWLPAPAPAIPKTVLNLGGSGGRAVSPSVETSNASGTGLGPLTRPSSVAPDLPASDSLPTKATPQPESINSLLQSNLSLLDTIKGNLAAYQMMENRDLLIQYHENLMSMLEKLGGLNSNAMMVHMPHLPVEPNLLLADNLLETSAPSANFPFNTDIGVDLDSTLQSVGPFHLDFPDVGVVKLEEDLHPGMMPKSGMQHGEQVDPFIAFAGMAEVSGMLTADELSDFPYLSTSDMASGECEDIASYFIMDDEEMLELSKAGNEDKQGKPAHYIDLSGNLPWVV
eukprot:gene14072-20018_t